jgi:regulator of protease activity HflC (stomatin/prohibitin superfamily)
MAVGIILGIVFAALFVGAFVWCGAELDEGNTGRSIIAGCLCLILFITFICVPFSFHTVQTGQTAVVKHLGKAKEIKDPGLHFDFWMTNKYQKYDTKVRELEIATMAYSSDAQQMTLTTKFQYQIMTDKVLDIANQYGTIKTLESRIKAIIDEKTKSKMSTYTAMNIIANRSTLSPEVEDIVKKVLGDKYYVDVVALAITNIDFSDAFENAVEEKMIAEQKQLKAEYEAEAKIVSAEATAKANELLERSLTDKILQEMYINKWDGKLPQVVTDGNTIFQLPN